jgi:hypothetical protein
VGWVEAWKGCRVKEPLLRLIACHRGEYIGDAVVRRQGGEKIKRGPLRGCMRVGGNVFKIGLGYVLEFRVVIRPGWPPEEQA